MKFFVLAMFINSAEAQTHKKVISKHQVMIPDNFTIIATIIDTLLFTNSSQ